VGDWYTVGLALGVGLGLGVILAAVLGANVVGLVVSAIAGAAAGALVGIAVGDSTETVAGGIGGLLGAMSAAVLVLGARRRGATRFGLAALLGVGGIIVAVVALVPALGYLEAVLLPVAAARMRTRQATRFAGLRTLAK
jgi:hypothetical protein